MLRGDHVAVIDHDVTIVAAGVVWRIFMVLRDFGPRTHITFGWFTTPAIRDFLCRSHGWESYQPGFVRETVARAELGRIQRILEEE